MFKITVNKFTILFIVKRRIISLITALSLIIGSFGIQGYCISDYSSKETTNDCSYEEVDNVVQKLIKSSNLPSLSICVVKDNDVIFSKGYGFSDIENNIQANSNSIYAIGSTTKTITGTAMMILYDRGLFHLDDDVNEYLPFTLRNPFFPRPASRRPYRFRIYLPIRDSLRGRLLARQSFRTSER